MQVISTLLLGLVVGAIAKLLMPGRDPGGIIITCLIGVGGAALAGFLGRAFGLYSWGDGPGLCASVLGSVLLLTAYRFTWGRAQP